MLIFNSSGNYSFNTLKENPIKTENPNKLNSRMQLIIQEEHFLEIKISGLSTKCSLTS